MKHYTLCVALALMCFLLTITMSDSHLLPGREINEKKSMLQNEEYKREMLNRLRRNLAWKCKKQLEFIDYRIRVCVDIYFQHFPSPTLLKQSVNCCLQSFTFILVCAFLFIFSI